VFNSVLSLDCASELAFFDRGGKAAAAVGVICCVS